MIDSSCKKNTSLRIETVQTSLLFTHRTAIVLQVLTVTHGILTINSIQNWYKWRSFKIQILLLGQWKDVVDDLQYHIWLVVSTILKNMKVNGKGYPIYETDNKIHDWNHQPVINGPIIFMDNFLTSLHLVDDLQYLSGISKIQIF